MTSATPAPTPQSGVIPYRWQAGQLQVLLITSRRRGRWIIPKGTVEPHLSPVESACKEAFEEAGVYGTPSAATLGSYRYRQLGAVWGVEVYALAVHTVLDAWPEMGARRRQWFALVAALELVEGEDLRDLIARLPELLAG